MNQYNDLTKGIDVAAEKQRELAFVRDQPIGAETTLKVFVCESDQVAYGKPVKIVELKAKVVKSHGPESKQIAIICPRFPGGICAGIRFGGLWMLAQRDMEPYPSQRW